MSYPNGCESHHVYKDFVAQPHLIQQPAGLSGWGWCRCVQDTDHHSSYL